MSWPFNWFRRATSDQIDELSGLVDTLSFSLTQVSQWKECICVNIDSKKEAVEWWGLIHTNGLILYINNLDRRYIVRKSDTEKHSQVTIRSKKLDAAVLKWRVTNLSNTLFTSNEDRAAYLLASQAAKISTETE